MNAIIEANRDLATIKPPFSEDEIVLHSKKSARTKRILEATREVIEDRKSALIELGKRSE